MVSPTSLPTSLHISPTQCTCLTSVSHQEYAIKDYHDTTGTKLRGFSAPFATGIYQVCQHQAKVSQM